MDVVVATLLEPGLRNRTFELTGPAAMTFEECVDAIASAAGYSIELVQIPLDDYIEALKMHSVPDYLPELLRELFADLFDGRNAAPANGVFEALGRAPTSFGEYARKTAAMGTWVREGEDAA